MATRINNEFKYSDQECFLSVLSPIIISYAFLFFCVHFTSHLLILIYPFIVVEETFKNLKTWPKKVIQFTGNVERR
jgi:hypothetical protein